MTPFEQFAPVLQSDTAPIVGDPRLLMDSEEGVSIYYAPFEYNNPSAKIVLVGITPGPTQMVNANNEARRSLLNGFDYDAAKKNAKETGGFSGEPMRSNLIKQLNHWGVHKWLNLNDSSELFSTARHLLQTTSLLRYPVFVDEKGYNGKPNMMNSLILKQYLFDHFVNDVSSLENAIFFPLGSAVTKVIDALVKQGSIDENKVATGLFHPSGQNTYRVEYSIGDRSQSIPHATNLIPYDQGRVDFRSRFL
ncbi:MAG: hypothetical protein K9L22_08350 [Methylococcaceae bacterium]|nr:hypothetical protein [Methylococcaceae bacterium]